MGIGSLAMACLLLAASPAPPAEEWHMNQTQFKIPISIKPDMQTDNTELRLFCSRDEGKTWNQVGTAKPSQDAFLFTTNSDGKYWFKVAVFHNGVQEPLDIFNAPVGQKIVIDTKPPEVHVAAERQGEHVAVAWDINEPYPRPETLKVEYHTSDAPDGIWNSVPVTAGVNKAAFKPDNTAAVVVRVQIEDRAGNLGTGMATVAGTAPAAAVVQAALPPPAPPPTGPANPTAPGGNPMPLPRPSELAPGATQASAPTQPPSGTPAGTNVPGSPVPAHVGLPKLQLINKSQVRLDYEVAKLGPSGVGSVDVYVTTDEGQTWEPCAAEAAPEMPVSEPHATVKGGVLVQLPKDEVTYGFYMVVKSRAGLGKPPPKHGDLPQIRIERDTTPPAVHWLRPMPDPNRRDTLVLAWEASDRNPLQNPVTLEWAEDPNGTWHPIGKPDLPNSGRYAWQVPADLKQPSVYLRISVRDAAGNVGVHQTEQPELVDLSVPEITITGLGSPSR